MPFPLFSAATLTGMTVGNVQGEHLGEIKDLVIDLHRGRIEYAVLSYGGVLGIGDKLFAIPWQAFGVDRERTRLLLDVSKEVLRNAPGFDKDNWPESADRSYLARVYRHYGYQPYWERF